MQRKTILTLGALAATAVFGAASLTAIAGPGHGPGEFVPGAFGPAPMMQRGGMSHGPMAAMTDSPVFRSFEADADGTVTPQEAEAGLAALHATHDADDDGALSAGEFAALFAAVTRGFAERPFAMLDADGDGALTAEEMAFPAQMMARMQVMQRNAAPEAAQQ